MTELEFENKWHLKVVRPKGHYQIPDKEYIVVGATLQEPETRFSIMAVDYSIENKQFIAFSLGEGEFQELDNRFEIIRDYNNLF